jgi:predicted nucleic acid-binding protein
MRLYLDMCSLQRPLDSKTQTRIAVEAEAILSIIAMIECGQLELVSSQSLTFEAEQITLPIRKSYVSEILLKATLFIPAQQIEKEARVFVSEGIKPLDALHLASAVVAKADYFCTCDDRFLKRAKKSNTGSTKAVSPLELIMEFES